MITTETSGPGGAPRTAPPHSPRAMTALVVGGTLIGLALALMLGRLVSTLLFGVSGRDPLTLAAVSAALSVVAVLACYFPARRAARVDPLVALRYE